jgi:hypothetical protein
LVIIDTSVWIEYFGRGDAALKADVIRLMRSGQVLLVGLVYLEVLRGARTEQEYRWFEENFGGMEFAESTAALWSRAGRLIYESRQRGAEVGLVDAVIAAHALEGGHEVLSRDSDFLRVPGLRLYEAPPP